MFYSVYKTEDLSLGPSTSDHSEGPLQRGERGSQDRSFCNKDQVVGISKDDC